MKRFKRCLTFFLVLSMVLGSMPVNASTADMPNSEAELPSIENLQENLTSEDDSVVGISLSDSLIQLEVGDTHTITYELLPDDTDLFDVEWLSSDVEIAVVDDGLVTAVAEGEVEITAHSAEDASIAAVCVVEVIPAAVILEETNEEINKGLAAMAATEMVAITTSMSGGYGSNGKFLAPIEAPVAGSIAISDREGLEAIANDLSGNYYLTADIDLSGEEWIPIGGEYNFRGSFDGQGYVIKNLVITGNNNENNGLFSYIYNASIKNVGMEGTYINISSTSGSYLSAGGICGDSSGSSLNIYNCYNTGIVSVSASIASAGGIMGYNTSNDSSAIISNCYNTGSISASASLFGTSDVSGASAGGICGDIYAASITNCYNSGEVSATLSDSDEYSAEAGGISGLGWGLISNSYNTGKVSVSSDNRGMAGGIRGDTMNYSAVIHNCYNTGDISSFSDSISSNVDLKIGGILGNAEGTISSCYNTGKITTTGTPYDTRLGGIAGESYGAYISNCYNTGEISATHSPPSRAFAGGICGYTWSSSTVSNCYNIGVVSAFVLYDYYDSLCYDPFKYGSNPNTISNCYSLLGLYSTQCGTLLTHEQMQDAANFIGFDFSSVWDISASENYGYPFLRMIAHSNNAATPTITKQPSDITVSVGGTATLSVEANVSSGNLSYQWYRNIIRSSSGGTLINDATSSTYSAPTENSFTYYYYCVITNTDNTATGNKTASIASNAARVTANPLSTSVGLNFGVDTYSFNNYMANFGYSINNLYEIYKDGPKATRESRYYISDSDYLKLKSYVEAYYSSYSARKIMNKIDKEREHFWEGSCYGMAVTTALDLLGQINFKKNYGSNAPNLYSIKKPIENDEIESGINYYFLVQMLPSPIESKTYLYDWSTLWDWGNCLESLVTEVKNNDLVLFNYSYKDKVDGKEKGHSILIYGYKSEVDGSHSLIAYDNNDYTEPVTIKINSDYSTIAVGEETDITQISSNSDFSVFDIVDIDGPNNDMVLHYTSGGSTVTVVPAKLYIPARGNFTITNDAGETLTYTDGLIGGS
ncbi:MAG: hypothetical protein GX660_15820, partial [Clostridiaceae bacterium]|nr:hypothetical protein [Clostridiaceae bacterium]